MTNIALVGCGYWGQNYARVLNELPEKPLKVCCDLDEKKLEKVNKKYPHIRTTTKIQEVMDNEDIDAIIISTPISTHYELVKYSLENGKHVLVEKPMTHNYEKGKEILRISKETGKKVMVGHTFLYNEGIVKMKELIENGEIGKLLYIYTKRVNLGPIRNDVNVLWDLAPHDVSILQFLLDKAPKHIVSQGASYTENGKEDVVFSTLKYPGNVIANIHVSWLDPHKIRNITVVGSKKMLTFDDTLPSDKLKIFDRGEYTNYYTETFADFMKLSSEKEYHAPKIKYHEPLKTQCQEFLSIMNSEKKTVSNAVFGAEVVRIIEEIQKSMG